jgi:hypothetical protein
VTQKCGVSMHCFESYGVRQKVNSEPPPPPNTLQNPIIPRLAYRMLVAITRQGTGGMPSMRRLLTRICGLPGPPPFRLRDRPWCKQQIAATQRQEDNNSSEIIQCISAALKQRMIAAKTISIVRLAGKCATWRQRS